MYALIKMLQVYCICTDKNVTGIYALITNQDDFPMINLLKFDT